MIAHAKNTVGESKFNRGKQELQKSLYADLILKPIIDGQEVIVDGIGKNKGKYKYSLEPMRKESGEINDGWITFRNITDPSKPDQHVRPDDLWQYVDVPDDAVLRSMNANMERLGSYVPKPKAAVQESPIEKAPPIKLESAQNRFINEILPESGDSVVDWNIGQANRFVRDVIDNPSRYGMTAEDSSRIASAHSKVIQAKQALEPGAFIRKIEEIASSEPPAKIARPAELDDMIADNVGLIAKIGMDKRVDKLDGYSIDDFTQDVMQKAIESQASFDPSRGSIGAWIAKIADNVAIDRSRRASAKKAVPESAVKTIDEAVESGESIKDNAAIEPSAGLEMAEEQAAVDAAIKKLPEQHQKVLELSKSGMGVKDIASQLGVGVRDVSRIKSDAINSIKEEVLKTQKGKIDETQTRGQVPGQQVDGRANVQESSPSRIEEGTPKEISQGSKASKKGKC